MRQLTPRCVGAVLCAVFLSAVSPAAAERDTVVVGMPQEPDTLGRFSVMSAARAVQNALFTLIALGVAILAPIIGALILTQYYQLFSAGWPGGKWEISAEPDRDGNLLTAIREGCARASWSGALQPGPNGLSDSDRGPSQDPL